MAVIQIPSLECEPGAENEFGTTDTYQIQSYTTGDCDGESGNLVKFYSSSAGTQATIDLSVCGDITVSYCYFKDIKVTGGTINCKDKTSTNAGNNEGILWPPTGNNIIMGNVAQLQFEYGVM